MGQVSDLSNEKTVSPVKRLLCCSVRMYFGLVKLREIHFVHPNLDTQVLILF